MYSREMKTYDYTIIIVAIVTKAKTRKNQISISRWMDKQNLINPYSKILLSNKKEWITDTLNNVDESQNHYAEWKKPDRKE